MLFMVLCPGTPEGSTGSSSGFKLKASKKTGQRLKVSSDRLGDAGSCQNFESGLPTPDKLSGSAHGTFN